MKIFTYILSLCLTLSSPFLFAQDGILDPNFGNNGTALVPNITLYTVKTQNSGKIIAAGAQFSSGYISNFNNDGTINTSFGDNGVLINAEGIEYYINILTLADDKFFIVGGSILGAYVQKYNSNGSLDSTYGNDGTAFIAGISPKGLIIQPDNKIVIGGHVGGTSDNQDFAVFRLTQDGVPDTEFGDNGLTTVAFTNLNDNIRTLGIDSNGKIIAGGSSTSVTSYPNLTLLRFNDDGSLDTTFGDNGVSVTVINENSYEEINALAILEDDSIIVSGMVDESFTILKFNSNGTLNTAFGDNGVTIVPFTDYTSKSFEVKIQTDGKIVAAGFAGNDESYEFVLIRLNSDGVLDNTFGTGGKIFNINTSINEIYFGLDIQPNGAILAAGPAGNDSVITRYLSGESLGTIDFFTANNIMFVYPNPLDETSVLEYTLANDEQISIELLDIHGKAVTTYVKNVNQGAGSYKQSIAVPSNLASGTYMVVLSSSKGKATVKVVK